MKDLYRLAAERGPEAELLLRCGRVHSGDNPDSRVGELLRYDLDWQLLINMARQHAVLPRLQETLNSAGWQDVPPASREEIEISFRDNAARNLAMVADLNQIIKICRSENIPVISFKGPVLSHQLYGNFAMRSSLDLDLLISGRDAAKLIASLGSAGYRSTLGLRPDQDLAYLQLQHQLPLAKRNATWLVEVHTALLVSGSRWARLESLIEQTQELQVGGLKTTVLAPEQLFTYLCVHGTLHRWRQLGWLCDIAQLVRVHPNLDWASIHQWSREAHYQRAISLGLTLARGLLSSAYEPEAQASEPRAYEPEARASDPRAYEPEAQASDPLRPNTLEAQASESLPSRANAGVVASLAEELATNLFRPQAPGEDRLGHLRFLVRSRERLLDGASGVWETTMKPTLTDWKFVSLPGSLSSLYYLLRPIRLLGEYSLAMLRHLRSRSRQTSGDRITSS